MGCFPNKSSGNTDLEVPDFRSKRKQNEKKEEIRFIKEFFSDEKKKFVQLNLKSNNLWTKRLLEHKEKRDKSF
jgi:protein-arginine kinase